MPSCWSVSSVCVKKRVSVCSTSSYASAANSATARVRGSAIIGTGAGLSNGWVSRKLRLLRAHGLIHKVTGTHRYHLTKAGRIATTAILTALRSSVRQLTTIAA